MSDEVQDAIDRELERFARTKTLAQDIAPQVIAAFETELVKTAAAGTDPDGNPWPATKTGSRPLKNAASAIKFFGRAVGTRIVVVSKVVGHHALHHIGRARGAPQRKILATVTPQAVRDKVAELVKGRLQGG